MYGSIFHMKVKPGKEQEFIGMFDEWKRERKPKIQGKVYSLMLESDNKPDEFVGVAVFPDKASYTANADNPEQDKWYRKMRELLSEDPAWEDGEFVVVDI